MSCKALERQCRKGNTLIPYLTYGDPSVADSEVLIEAAIAGGASVIELGIPFSDPIADGPVIQASHQRALESGQPSIANAFQTLQKFAHHDIPFIFMLSINLVINYGEKRFFEDARTAGLSGVIIPDAPIEESVSLSQLAKQHDVGYIQLVSPLTPPDRIEKIVKKASGFVYLISSQGITGERDKMDMSLKAVADQIKAVKDVPIIVGFGVSKPEHLRQLSAFTNGVIVGSHIIKLIEPHLASVTTAAKKLTERLQDFKV